MAKLITKPESARGCSEGSGLLHWIKGTLQGLPLGVPKAGSTWFGIATTQLVKRATDPQASRR